MTDTFNLLSLIYSKALKRGIIRRMNSRTTIYFATDVHGSERCFRKFLNAGPIYKADIMIMGGDLAGKELQVIRKSPNGGHHFTLKGKKYEIETKTDLAEAQQLIADIGFYSYISEPDEIEEMQKNDTFEKFMETLMRERVIKWLEMANERLRPLNMPLYWMLGNDDPQSWAPLLRQASWGSYAEDGVLLIDDKFEMISWGYSNPTPWQTAREETEEQLLVSIEKLASQIKNLDTAIFNLHAPPFESGLDEAPFLNENWVVQNEGGQVKMVPVGSKSVRSLIEKYQPLLSLHGHIHESPGFRKMGRTLAINPGSDHITGSLSGVLVTLDKGKIKGHQIVRG
jgi:Icc-related predicted phosphoesterase